MAAIALTLGLAVLVGLALGLLGGGGSILMVPLLTVVAGMPAGPGPLPVVRIDAAVLRTLFGWFVLLMAGALVAQHGAPIAGAVAVGVTVLAFGCRYAERCPWALIPPRVTLT